MVALRAAISIQPIAKFHFSIGKPMHPNVLKNIGVLYFFSEAKTIGVLLISQKPLECCPLAEMGSPKQLECCSFQPWDDKNHCSVARLQTWEAKNHWSVAHFQAWGAQNHWSVAHFQIGEAKTIGVWLI
jgi:hypothetical protein